MTTYIIRRLLLMIPTLIGITAVVFFVMALSPGGVSTTLMADLERGLRPQEREALRKYYNDRYGLDKPKVVQYGRWLNQVSPIRFDTGEGGYLKFTTIKVGWPNLGESIRRRPVLDMIAEALPITLLMNLISMPLVYLIAIPSGIMAARHRGKWFDISSNVVFLAMWSLPPMWVGVMLIGFFANKDYWYWFPAAGLHANIADQMFFLPRWTDAGFERGWLLDAIWHLVLPVFCLTYGGFAFLAKLMRSAILDNLSADFVRTARAKGVSDHTVLFTHVLRNSILPLITVAAGILPGLLGGSVIIETIFSIPGMGKLMVDAIFARDRELVLASTLIVGVIGMFSLLLADICYAIADPRVSYE